MSRDFNKLSSAYQSNLLYFKVVLCEPLSRIVRYVYVSLTGTFELLLENKCTILTLISEQTAMLFAPRFVYLQGVFK